ncbi:MFS transporter [Herbiconiux moechotypicola]|uniref:MFS transporter n=1 Tax=Herbiconiux moechotypicola TaxID=637393 RepID=A0ABN3DC29_9MICO|nr:MFS transporter [Herbiconiux moechotypicola]MCS5728816.1 MFS transporter [Herbiconiux moechotypicola]
MTSTLAAPSPATEPITVLATRPPWKHTLLSLSVRNYRIFAGTSLVALTALWMQRIAQDWLVLELSGSVVAVGVTTALQFAPMLVLGLLGGLIVDRYPKHTLLMITQSASALTSAALAVLALTGWIEVWHVYVVAVVLGLITVVDNPARQVFTNELVGPSLLRNAISLNSSTFQLGALIGPAVSGALLVAVGAGWSFAVNALACALVVLALSRMNLAELHRAPRAVRAKGQLREGIRYSLAKPAILWTIVLLAVIAVFGQNLPVLLAAYADDVFSTGAGGYGLFNTLVAVGALTGALLSTRRRAVRLRTVVAMAAVYGVAQGVAGLMPAELAFGATLVVSGFAWLLFITAANTLVQMSTNMAVRGRVMALYMLVLLGGQAVGGPLMGTFVEAVGPQIGMLVSGGVPALAAAVVALVLHRRGLLRAD